MSEQKDSKIEKMHKKKEREEDLRKRTKKI